MARDPFADLQDAPLFIVPRVLDGLRAYRAAPTPAAPALGRLAATLLEGIERHPTKSWVLRQFQKTLQSLAGEEAATLSIVRAELEKLMDILGIGSADGVLGAEFR